MRAYEYLRHKQKLKRESAIKFLKLAGTLLLVTVSAFASLFSFNSLLARKENTNIAQSILERGMELNRQRSLSEFNNLKGEVDSLRAALSSLQIPSSQEQQSSRITFLESDVTSIDSRLKLLETAISNSPERALAVPMLRKDHDALSKIVSDNANAVKADYDRLWGLLVLFLGTSASAVALIGGWFLKDVSKKNEKTPVAKS